MEIKFRENETLELKKSTSELKAAIISIASILNKHGFGELYFGIKNDGKIVGQEISEKTLRDISQSIAENIEPKIYPDINVVKIENKSCIYIQFLGREKPYYAFGRAYTRVGDEDRKLSAKEIENIILKKHNKAVSWESQLSDKTIDQLDEEIIKKFVEKANTVGRLEFKHETTETTIRKLDLINNGWLLNAGEVLFCDENPLVVQMAIFAGKEKLTFLDIKQLRGNIFYLLDESELYIKNHINWRVKFGKLEREEIPEIPVDAIREALVNSLCHKDYKIPKSNEVAIFKDRVEIYNPGDFPEGLNPQDFIEGYERSILRNPLISQVLYYSKDVERWGSGLKRIYEDCMKNHVKVEFNILKTGFLVVFYRRDDVSFSARKKEVHEGVNEGLNEGVSEGVNESVNKGVNRLYDYIKQNPGQRTRVISEVMGIPLKTIERWIKKLKDNNKIKFIGSSRTGGYYIIGVSEGVNEGLNEGVNKGVNKEVNRLYDYIKQNPGQRIRLISETLDIPSKTIERWIKKLKDNDKIKFVGSSRTGGYYIIGVSEGVNEGLNEGNGGLCEGVNEEANR
jgi:ATP-dependent DNA helicase RecG